MMWDKSLNTIWLQMQTEHHESDEVVFDRLLTTHTREHQFLYLDALVINQDYPELIDHIFTLKEEYLQFIEALFHAVWLNPDENPYYSADKQWYETFFCWDVTDEFGEEFMTAFQTTISIWVPMIINTIKAHLAIIHSNASWSSDNTTTLKRLERISTSFTQRINIAKEQVWLSEITHQLAEFQDEIEQNIELQYEAEQLAESIEEDIRKWYSYLAILWRLIKEQYFFIWSSKSQANTPTIDVRIHWIHITVAKQPSQKLWQNTSRLPQWRLKSIVHLEREALESLKQQTHGIVNHAAINWAITRADKIATAKNPTKALRAYQEYCKKHNILIHSLRPHIWVAWGRFQNEFYRSCNRLSKRALLQIKNISKQIDALKTSIKKTTTYWVTRWRANPEKIWYAQDQLKTYTRDKNNKILSMQQRAVDQMQHLDTRTLLNEAQKPWFINSLLRFNKYTVALHWWAKKLVTSKYWAKSAWFFIWMWVWTYLGAWWSQALNDSDMLRTLWNDLWDMTIWFIPIFWWINDVYIAMRWTDWNERVLTWWARAERVWFWIIWLIPWVGTIVKLTKQSKKWANILKALEWIQKIAPNMYKASWVYSVWKLWLVGVASTWELVQSLYNWVGSWLHTLLHAGWDEDFVVPEFSDEFSLEIPTVWEYVDSFVQWFHDLSLRFSSYWSYQEILAVFERTLLEPLYSALWEEYSRECIELAATYKKILLQSLHYQWFLHLEEQWLPEEYSQFIDDLQTEHFEQVRIVSTYWTVMWERKNAQLTDHMKTTWRQWPLWTTIVTQPPIIWYDGMKLYAYNPQIDLVGMSQYLTRYRKFIWENVHSHQSFWFDIQDASTHMLQGLLFHDIWLVEDNGMQFLSISLFDSWKMTTCLIPISYLLPRYKNLNETPIIDLSHTSVQWYINQCLEYVLSVT
jgi:hypothetical protein